MNKAGPEVFKTIDEKKRKFEINDNNLDISILRILSLIKDECNIPKLTANQIASIIDNIFEEPINSKSVSNILRMFVKNKSVKQYKQRGADAYEIKKRGRVLIKKEAKDEIRERFYAPRSPYIFYTDLKKLFQNVQKEILIVDSYINKKIFDNYIEQIPKKVLKKIKIRVLTSSFNNKLKDFYDIAKLFRKEYNFDERQHELCHDRVIFIDAQAWVIGQSLDNAGVKPTYLIKIENSIAFKKIFEKLWSVSKKGLK